MMYYVGCALVFPLSSVYPLVLSKHLCTASAFLLHLHPVPSIVSSYFSVPFWGVSLFFFHVCASFSYYRNLSIMSVASLCHCLVQHHQKSLLVPNLISNITMGYFTLTCMPTYMLSLTEVYSLSLDAVVEVSSHNLWSVVGQAQFSRCS